MPYSYYTALEPERQIDNTALAGLGAVDSAAFKQPKQGSLHTLGLPGFSRGE